MVSNKIQIKLSLENNTFSWSHFCYVPQDTKDKFDKYVNNKRLLNNHWISLWAYEDFGLMEIDTIEGLNRLKETVKAKYKERYPELYLDSNTDKQGWLRLWYTENMEKELKKIGR